MRRATTIRRSATGLLRAGFNPLAWAIGRTVQPIPSATISRKTSG
jgi:hypothetical protein